MVNISTPLVMAESYKALTHRWGAYSNCDDKDNPGLFPEVIKAAGKSLGIDIECTITPWKRAQKIVSNSQSTQFIFPLTRTASRENKYKWVSKIVVDKKVFFANKKLNFKPNQLGEFIKMRIGVVQGSPYEKEIKGLKLLNVDSVAGVYTNAKKLFKDRIDLWYAPYNTVIQAFKELGLSTDNLYAFHSIGETNLFIGASLATPDVTIKQLSQEIEKLRSSGKIEELYKKYQVISKSD